MPVTVVCFSVKIFHPHSQGVITDFFFRSFVGFIVCRVFFSANRPLFLGLKAYLFWLASPTRLTMNMRPNVAWFSSRCSRHGELDWMETVVFRWARSLPQKPRSRVPLRTTRGPAKLATAVIYVSEREIQITPARSNCNEGQSLKQCRKKMTMTREAHSLQNGREQPTLERDEEMRQL